MSEDMRHDDVSPAINRITGAVCEAAVAVHRELGPGLLERTYRVCIAHELRARGHRVEEEKALPVTYRGIYLEAGYRIDILVDDEVIVELKVVDALDKSHFAQLSTYLKLAPRQVGLLINFNAVPLRHGIKRVVRTPEGPAVSAVPA